LFRQISPKSSSARNPEYGIYEMPVVCSRPTGISGLVRERVFDCCPLFVRDLVSSHRQLFRESSDAELLTLKVKIAQGECPQDLAVLHTWNGQLGYHPNVYLLIIGGGITPNGRHWELAQEEFLVSVTVLSYKIAAQFRVVLKAAALAIFAGVSATV
jgi:Putative transposase